MIAYAMKVQIVKKGSTLLCRQVTTFMLQKSPQIREKKKKHFGFKLVALQYFLTLKRWGWEREHVSIIAPMGINKCSWV